MQTTKKKPSLIFILVGAVLAGYLGYLINGAWTEGIAFNEFMDRFNEVCAVPFANYYNSNTVKAVAIALGIYAMAIVMYYTCLLYTSPSPRDTERSRMPSSA